MAVLFYITVLLLINVVPTESFFGNDFSLSGKYIMFVRLDHLLHLLVFLPWMSLLWLYLRSKKASASIKVKHSLLWFLTGLFVAALVEYMQCYIPYRSFNPVDLRLNILGVVSGSIIFIWRPKGFDK